ncbi:hypothetical protein DMB44_04255 [Thermoplasma sp. Kam2015]|uniref:hypothetical protein n=1 Tax=Thermoplasma sp. Kam2015 TaxID=2094122 RepID=UPI000D963B45|nr:hypothetical protein [Thermoplasma sp. Kam2015]PYB68553.1 hypothetical protein DMB44_04255 [Thermoplasma sp. Kam2015]
MEIDVPSLELFYKAWVKREAGKPLEEFEKRIIIVQILEQRGLAKVDPGDPIVSLIKREIGSLWDLPMPIAALDIPDTIEDLYRDLADAH